ncbi:MAG: hypothetical protein P0S94_00975 [Simkaniaceae bacterium]|nr:hypothetical protein [Simkaniaceae bacterium]
MANLNYFQNRISSETTHISKESRSMSEYLSYDSAEEATILKLHDNFAWLSFAIDYRSGADVSLMIDDIQWIMDGQEEY